MGEESGLVGLFWGDFVKESEGEKVTETVPVARGIVGVIVGVGIRTVVVWEGDMNGDAEGVLLRGAVAVPISEDVGFIFVGVGVEVEHNVEVGVAVTDDDTEVELDKLRVREENSDILVMADAERE